MNRKTIGLQSVADDFGAGGVDSQAVLPAPQHQTAHQIVFLLPHAHLELCPTQLRFHLTQIPADPRLCQRPHRLPPPALLFFGLRTCSEEGGEGELMELALGSMVAEGAGVSEDGLEDGETGEVLSGESAGFLFLLLDHGLGLEDVELLLGLAQLLLDLLLPAALRSQLVLDELVRLLEIAELVSLAAELALHERGLLDLELQLADASLVQLLRRLPVLDLLLQHQDAPPLLRPRPLQLRLLRERLLEPRQLLPHLAQLVLPEPAGELDVEAAEGRGVGDLLEVAGELLEVELRGEDGVLQHLDVLHLRVERVQLLQRVAQLHLPQDLHHQVQPREVAPHVTLQPDVRIRAALAQVLLQQLQETLQHRVHLRQLARLRPASVFLDRAQQLLHGLHGLHAQLQSRGQLRGQPPNSFAGLIQRLARLGVHIQTHFRVHILARNALQQLHGEDLHADELVLEVGIGKDIGNVLFAIRRNDGQLHLEQRAVEHGHDVQQLQVELNQRLHIRRVELRLVRERCRDRIEEQVELGVSGGEAEKEIEEMGVEAGGEGLGQRIDDVGHKGAGVVPNCGHLELVLEEALIGEVVEAAQLVVLVLVDVGVEVGLDHAFLLAFVHALQQRGVVLVQLLHALLVLVLLLSDQRQVPPLLLLLGSLLRDLLLQVLDLLRLQVDDLLRLHALRLQLVDALRELLQPLTQHLDLLVLLDPLEGQLLNEVARVGQRLQLAPHGLRLLSARLQLPLQLHQLRQPRGV